jgi:hypothetical protein
LSSSAGDSVAKLLRRHPSGLIPRREGLNFQAGTEGSHSLRAVI